MQQFSNIIPSSLYLHTGFGSSTSYPRFGPEEEFVLETDASLNGLAAVLGQRQDDSHVHPIAYASRSLQPHETNYAITELEILALIGVGCENVQTIYPGTPLCSTHGSLSLHFVVECCAPLDQPS